MAWGSRYVLTGDLIYSTLRQDTSQSQSDKHRVLVEISRLQSQLRGADRGQQPSGHVPERLLDDLKSDAATVLDKSNYLANQFEYDDDNLDTVGTSENSRFTGDTLRTSTSNLGGD